MRYLEFVAKKDHEELENEMAKRFDEESVHRKVLFVVNSLTEEKLKRLKTVQEIARPESVIVTNKWRIAEVEKEIKLHKPDVVMFDMFQLLILIQTGDQYRTEIEKKMLQEELEGLCIVDDVDVIAGFHISRTSTRHDYTIKYEVEY